MSEDATDELRVVRWTSVDECRDAPCPFGGWGGWFGAKGAQLWADYVGVLDPTAVPYAEALRAEILRLNIKRGGDWHQIHGVPVFSDGTAAVFSMRAWGDFMAAVWSTPELPLKYMDFYLDCTMPKDFQKL